MTDSIGVGFVGGGFMGRAHAHAIHTINHIAPLPKRVRLVAIAGGHAERTASAASQLGFEGWSTNWAEVVENDQVDVLANLGPTTVHEEPSIAALELGKPVLCEKPLAATAEAAGEMVTAAQSANVTNACGFNYRFIPAIRLARELVASGQLGAIRHFRGAYLQDWAGPNYPGTWRFQAAEGGALTDYSHIVDLMRYLVGEPAAVSAVATTFITERPDPTGADRVVKVNVEDAYASIGELPGGGLVVLEASRCATGWKGRQVIEINGSDGSLWWNMEDLNRLHVFFVKDESEGVGGFRDTLVTQANHPFMDPWWGAGHILGWEHTFVHQWREFLISVLEQRPVSVDQASFHDGYRSAVVCDAILKATKDRRRVEIAHNEPSETSAKP